MRLYHEILRLMKKLFIMATIGINALLFMAGGNLSMAQTNSMMTQNNNSSAQSNWRANPVGAVFAREGAATPEGSSRVTGGGYEVYSINSADKTFQPASLYYGVNDADKAKVDTMAPDGKVPTAMNCFVVRTPDGFVMFDTGLPASKGGKTLERLKALNIAPDEVKAIFLTHAHFDHIGGLLDDKGNPEFPSATLYIPGDELNFMRQTMAETAALIDKAYVGKTVVFNSGDILPFKVLPISAKGHTPGHTAYLLGNLFFVGDIMHGAALQLIDPTICANFDANRQEAIDTRNRILSYAVAKSLTVLGAHIPVNGILF